MSSYHITSCMNYTIFDQPFHTRMSGLKASFQACFQACLPFILLPFSSSTMYIFHDRYSCTKLAEMLIWVIFRTTTRSTTSAPSVLTTSRSSTAGSLSTPSMTIPRQSLARSCLFVLMWRSGSPRTRSTWRWCTARRGRGGPGS